MSNSEMAPKASELLNSLKPYGKYPWYPSKEDRRSYRWEFSVGELYGCVCHRPLDELARSPLDSNLASELSLPERGVERVSLGSTVGA